MSTKTILIVDDEESVLYVLKNSLIKLGHEYRILTAQDGNSALRFFEKYQIDLVVTDYRMNGMNGLELLETIRNVQPSTCVIFITAFGSDEVEAEVSRLKVFAYLKKPLDLATFRSVVKQALGDLSTNRPGVVIHADDINFYITQTIQFLKKEINASCAMVVDIAENVYITVGEIDKMPKEQLVAFVNTALSILDKAGRLLDGETSPSVWLFREGVRDDLFAGRVDSNHLLIVLTSHDPQAQSKNQVVELIQRTVTSLQERLIEVTKNERERIFGQGFNQAVQTELDKLFTDDFELSFSQNNPIANADKLLAQPTQFTMSYEEALAVGLILPTEENGNSGDNTETH